MLANFSHSDASRIVLHLCDIVLIFNIDTSRMIPMTRSQDLLREIQDASERLRSVSRACGDSQRAEIAARLSDEFAGLVERREIRAVARNWLGIYRGGMGSFSDVGSQDMSDAVEGLRRALRRASRPW